MMYPSRSVLLGQTNSIEDALAGSVGRMRSHLAFQNKSALSRAKQFGSRWVDFRNATPNSYSYGMGVDPSTVDFRNAPSSTSSSGVGVVPIEPLGATRPRLGVDQVGFGRRFLGSSPGSAPEVVQRDQYGLSTPLGQGNIDNTRSRVSPGVLGRQKSTETGYMGSLGGGSSEVHRIGGKNVVMGGGTLQRYSEAIGVGMSPEEAYAKAKVGAEQRARDTNMSNPMYAAMQERKQQAWQDRLAEKSAIRSAFRAKKYGALAGSEPSMLATGGARGYLSSVKPLHKQPDVRQRQIADSKAALDAVDPDEFAHLGLDLTGGYQSHHSRDFLDALKSDAYAQMSPQGQADYNDFLQHYINVYPEDSFTDPRVRKAFQHHLSGNRVGYNDLVKQLYKDNTGPYDSPITN